MAKLDQKSISEQRQFIQQFRIFTDRLIAITMKVTNWQINQSILPASSTEQRWIEHSFSFPLLLPSTALAVSVCRRLWCVPLRPLRVWILIIDELLLYTVLATVFPAADAHPHYFIHFLSCCIVLWHFSAPPAIELCCCCCCCDNCLFCG